MRINGKLERRFNLDSFFLSGSQYYRVNQIELVPVLQLTSCAQLRSTDVSNEENIFGKFAGWLIVS